jgi:flagellar basal body-associated protein FliL
MKKIAIIFIVLSILLVATGFFVYKSVFTNTSKQTQKVEDEEIVEILPQVDASVLVDVKKSVTKDNTVIMKVSGMAGKMASVGYELTYDSQGLIQIFRKKPIETTTRPF